LLPEDWPYSVLCDDLNADGRTDFGVTLWFGGRGTAALYHERVVFLSSAEAGYRIWRVPTMAPSSADWIEPEPGERRLISSLVVDITPAIEILFGRSYFAYWVHNLIAVDGDRMVVANQLDPRFPLWIGWSVGPSHRPSRRLSAADRKTLLAAHGFVLVEEVAVGAE